MTVEVRPLGIDCNLGCTYCYQNPQRSASNYTFSYDLGRIQAAIESQGQEFSLFGGEPLLVPVEDLERLWAWGFDRFGRNGVQTNGTLLGDAHVRLFKRYNVRVGISIDGPGSLNDARWYGTLERTRQATRATERAIARLCEEGLRPSLIVTLHRLNATAERLPELTRWIHEVDDLGVRAIRLHALEVDEPERRADLALSEAENVHAFGVLRELEAELRLHFDLFRDMEAMLLGRDRGVTCTHRACDPYTTRAVQGIESDGSRSNCGRTNKDGVDFVKSAEVGYERYLALFHTPQRHGGCAGCRFFLMCKGDCPGGGLDGDWRNRGEHCGVWKVLYEQIEADLLAGGELPLSVNPLRRDVEATLLGHWAAGRNPDLSRVLAECGAAGRSGEVRWAKDPPHRDYKDAPFNDGHRDTPDHSDYPEPHDDGHFDAFEDGWL